MQTLCLLVEQRLFLFKNESGFGAGSGMSGLAGRFSAGDGGDATRTR